ncbi:YjiH family protein [Alkalibacillus haloalkaliphilus]|uniref:Membrane protein n=1 Tax=Alkalibacillus haloalkaliphilus TaxID=94136 RepID=A0A511W486_9BACI|nr:YjiH family protein [Alkalibacillus haloalkaliphilus]GEN45904.1 membrane protein [Alkalibacillus haloalkaliphilus]
MGGLQQKYDVEGNIKGSNSLKVKLTFLIPSLIGILLFLVPISVDGQYTIGIGLLADYLLETFSDHMPYFVVGLLGASFILSLLATFMKIEFIEKSDFLTNLFKVTSLGLIVRGFGFLVGLLTIMTLGPTIINSPGTGEVVLYDLAPVLLTWFLFAGLFLPLLMQFGLMEFIGSLLNKVMRPLFTLPGRSSIDSMASWMGAGPVGVLVTSKQFDEGYYNRREAAVIATTFSVASIAFSLVIANVIGVGHLFIPFYLTVVAASLVAAIIMPRIPPLSRKKNTYREDVGKQINDASPEGVSALKWGWIQATQKASQAKGFIHQFKSGLKTVADIWFGLIPLVMSLGVIALILVEFTPIFNVLSYPLVPLLELLRIPEASAAAPAMLVGFADMFLPAVVGSSIESELTRFVIGALSVAQIIYMSEIGVLILKSNIPVKLHELFIIFLQRTLISLPIIALIAHLLIFT